MNETQPKSFSPDKRRIVHCSDLHFGRGFQPALADKLLEQIEVLQPDAVVVSGDLTMRARPGQFSLARDFLRQIRVPLLVIPGNHDVPLYNIFVRLLAPFDNYLRYTEGLGTKTLELPGVALYGINSINPHRHQQGRFSREQIEQMTHWMHDKPAGTWRIAVAHQHFVAIPGYYRPGAIRDAQRVLGALSKAGIHGVLCGHMHFKYIGSSRDFFPLIERPVALIHAGTATSRRLRGNFEQVNSFNVLDFAPEQFVVTPYDWNETHRHFAPGEHSVFDRAFYGESAAQ